MSHLKRFLRRDVLSSTPIVGGFLTFVSAVLGQSNEDASSTQTPSSNSLGDQSLSLEALQRELRDLRARLEEADSQISRLSQFDSPVGSVLGYLGPIPSDENARWEWERRTGWLVCDGRPLSSKSEFKELQSLLGMTHLPDMRCRFLRGVDVPIEGKFANLDEVKNRLVGTLQDHSTARPTPRDGEDTRFGTNRIPEIDLTTTRGSRFIGDNAHFNMLMSEVRGKGTVKETDTTGGEPNLYDCAAIKNVPAHDHAIEFGGNAETRPYNTCVFWIIKASSRGFSTLPVPNSGT